MYKKPRRRMRTIGVAAAIFAVGAGLGWNFAGLIFATKAPTPTVAAVRFEDRRPDAIPSTRRYEAVPTAPAQTEDRRYYQPDLAVRPSDEEQRLAEALQWAERYRQRQEMSVQNVIARQVQEERMRLAAAEAQRWAEVSAHANRVKQPPFEIQQLVAAQGEQHGTGGVVAGTKLASAGGAIVSGTASVEAQSVARRTRLVRCEHCGDGRRQARGVRKTRVAGYRRRGHRAEYGLDGWLCPFRWLEAALTGERHGGRRYAQRQMWLG